MAGLMGGWVGDGVNRQSNPLAVFGWILAALAFWGIVWLFSVALATPPGEATSRTASLHREAPHDGERLHSGDRKQAGLSSEGSVGSDSPPGGASPGTPSTLGGMRTASEEQPVTALPLTGNIGTAAIGGYATWYDAPSSKDAAAGPALRDLLGDWRGQWVVVSKAGQSIRVQLTDSCACGSRNGKPTLVDLDDRAFAQLAPLSSGVVLVSIEVTGQPTLPPTDTEESR